MGGFEIRCRVSEEEIIEKYLRPKIEGETCSIPGFIVEVGEELYTKEPWLHPRQTAPILNPREWFYFGKRCPNKLHLPEGVRVRWLLDEGHFPIFSEKTGDQIGVTTRFKYHYRREKGVAMRKARYWFMREYRLYNKERGISRQVFCIITCNDPSFVV